MINIALKERIESISRKQIMQLLSDEVCGMCGEVYVEIIGETQLTKDVAEFGFSVLTDEGYEDVVGCFYSEDNVSMLMIYIDSKTLSEALINYDNKSISITFADNRQVYIEFM